MTPSDAEHWDARYEGSERPNVVNSPALVASEFVKITSGSRVLDVACGWGDAGLHCAQLGAEVTFVDVSAVALNAVEARAASLDLTVSTVVEDLTTGSVPPGPWDLITCTHYLDRLLLPRLVEALSPNGQLACAIATTTNLERHERPSARFLLELDELPTLIPTAEVVHYSEQWRANGVHEAWLVAKRSTSSSAQH